MKIFGKSLSEYVKFERGFLILILVVWRTALEDRFLFQNLQGYPEFAAHTRYRLIPGIW